MGCAFTAAQAQTSFPIYVTNQSNDTVTAITSTGGTSTFASGTGLNRPFGLVFDSSGNLYVANYDGDDIEKFSPTGTDLGVFAATGSDTAPYGLAIDGSGNIFAALVTGGAIDKITPSGSVSTFASGLGVPTDVAFDSSGNVYETNNSSNTVNEYTSSGSFIGVFISAGLDAPQGLAFDHSGNLYVSNSGNDTIEEYTSSGSSLGVFFSSGSLKTPEGLAFDTAGNLYVANADNVFGNNILEITPSGSGSIFAQTTTPAFITFSIPEPSCLLLFCAGAAGLAMRRRRK